MARSALQKRIVFRGTREGCGGSIEPANKEISHPIDIMPPSSSQGSSPQWKYPLSFRSTRPLLRAAAGCGDSLREDQRAGSQVHARRTNGVRTVVLILDEREYLPFLVSRATRKPEKNSTSARTRNPRHARTQMASHFWTPHNGCETRGEAAHNTLNPR